MSFDPNANPESVAARAAELALEQLDRLKGHIKKYGQEKAADFYKDDFEIGISNKIAQLMGGYAVLKGYVTEEQANRQP